MLLYISFMPDDNPPIKRSSELAPLSREHHEGLLFVWKIRQGLLLQIDHERLARFVQWFYTVIIVPHFEIEEKVLIPILGKKMSLKEQMLDEHAVVRKLVHEVAESPSTALFQRLAEVYNDHIRFEERILFKHIEVSVTPVELKALGLQLAEVTGEMPVWDDAFWLK